MFLPFKRKASPRRQAIRDDMVELGIAVQPETGHRRSMLAIAAVFWVVAALLQLWQSWPQSPVRYREGEIPPVDLYSPVTFNFVDPAEATRARELARETTPPVLATEKDTVALVGSQLLALRADVEGVSTVATLPAVTRAHYHSLTDERLRALQTMTMAHFTEAVESFKQNADIGLRTIPIITLSDKESLGKLRRASAGTQVEMTEVRLAKNNTLENWLPLVSLRSVYVLSETGVDPSVRPEIARLVGQSQLFPQAVTELVTDCLMGLTVPTYRYDAKLSAALIDQQATSYMQSTHFQAGQRIARGGEVLTVMQYEQIRQAQAALESQIVRAHPWSNWISIIGLILTAGILTGAGTIYCARVGTKLTVRRAGAIAGLLAIMLVLAKAVVTYFPYQMLGMAPTLLAAIILVIAENPRFSLGLSALHGLLVTLTLRAGIDFYVPLLAGCAIFCFGLSEIRTRGKLIEVGAVAGTSIFIAIWAMGMSRLLGLGWSRWIGTADANVIWQDSLWGAGAGMGVSMFALAALPSIERIFKITTAMTLLELCDANRPLMVRLSQEAPGTFNHSLTVGIMAEAAGNAIGANGLLCRVGAYYHDIGKLSKPQYFIENQAAGHPNRHDKLSPAMSLLIIVGHVKDGIELAREYGLPSVVHQFIGQHHGTTLVEYFFHAARKRAERDENSAEVSETEFRYPGPKPQTRETAIVMICDGCESAVRAIEEPTPGRIEAAVHSMIMKRLMDGQFSECDLTLRELSIIEETLVRTLAGIHHGRVAYPSNRQSPGTGVSDVGLSQPA